MELPVIFKTKKRSHVIKFPDFFTGKNLDDVYVKKYWELSHKLAAKNKKEALNLGVSAADDLIQVFGGTQKIE